MLLQNAHFPVEDPNEMLIDVDDVMNRGTLEYTLRGGRGSGAKPV